MSLKESNYMDYWHNDNPVCPHCDKRIDVAADDLTFLYNEGEHTIFCPYCDKEITIQSNCTRTFDTDMAINLTEAE